MTFFKNNETNTKILSEDLIGLSTFFDFLCAVFSRISYEEDPLSLFILSAIFRIIPKEILKPLSKVKSLKQLENDDLKIISLIPNIMGMMGDRMPMLLKETDVRRILKDDTLEEHIENKKLKFDTGEPIIVCEGPFNDFSGIIKEVKGDKVDVEIKIFGRNTAVSLSLDQIRKP